MSTTRQTRTSARTLLALVLPAILSLTLGACGDDATDVDPSTGSGSATSSGGDAFAECLAEQGVDLPAEGETPDPGSIDPDQMQSAMDACGELAPSDMPSGAPSGEPDQSALDAFADCLKDHKVDVEPTLEAIQQLDRDDTKVNKALDKCSALLTPPGSS